MESESSAQWVERLFARLQVRYGNRWTRMWEGINPEAIKADWREQLGALYLRHPEAIGYGLEHLPENPPTSDQFKALCVRAPDNVVRLPPPKSINRGFAAGVAQQIELARRAITQSPAAYCAGRLRTWSQRNGQPMTQAQRDMLAACDSMCHRPEMSE